MATKTPDLSAEQCGELIELTAANEAIAQRLEADLLAVKLNDKKIAALLAIRRAFMIAAGKRSGTRHGVEFKLIDKPGTVSWKGEVEALKGSEYAALVAANAPTVTKIEYKFAA
jgi:hypothetical protein